MPNIIDVAREANVSPATVSRALNNSHLVSDEKKARVRAAAEKLGYQLPLRSSEPEDAQSLSGGVLLCIGVEHPLLQDFLMNEAAKLQSSALFLPVGMQSPAQYTASIQNATGFLRSSQQLCAVILGCSAAPLLSPQLWTQWGGIPVVQLAECSGPDHQYIVSIDYTRAAHDATCAMLQLGRRDIRLLTQLTERTPLRPDIQFTWGYRAAMAEAAVVAGPDCVTACEPTRDGGIEWVQTLLQDGQPVPDTIFCTSDLTAIGCIQALQQNGITIPEQTAVLALGCDSSAGYASTPMLSTVEGMMQEIGSAIMHMLRLLMNGEAGPSHRIIIPHTFFCRGSIPQLDPNRWPIFD